MAFIIIGILGGLLTAFISRIIFKKKYVLADKIPMVWFDGFIFFVIALFVMMIVQALPHNTSHKFYQITEAVTVKDSIKTNNLIMSLDESHFSINTSKTPVTLIPYDKDYLGIVNVKTNDNPWFYIFSEQEYFLFIPRQELSKYVTSDTKLLDVSPFEVPKGLGTESNLIQNDTNIELDDTYYKIIEFGGKKYVVPSEDASDVIKAIENGDEFDSSKYFIISDSNSISDKTPTLTLSYKAFNVENTMHGVIIRSEEQPVVIIPTNRVKFVAQKDNDDSNILVEVYTTYTNGVENTEYVIYLHQD